MVTAPGDLPMISVPYAKFGGAADGFQHAHATTLALPTVVERLRAAIEAAAMWVLDEINPQALLSRGGYVIRPARQLLFFHPKYMARLLAADPSALLEAPLKFAKLELPDRSVWVRYLDPIDAFARYQSPDLRALGVELAALSHEIVTTGLGQQPSESR